MLETERLILRPWQRSDLEPFYQINHDARVMEYFPNVLTLEESNQLALRIQDNMQKNGFGLWAVSIKNGAPFIGFIGLSIPAYQTHFTPCVEIGWRLGFDFWGQGYATEGAKACLHFGFEELKLEEIVSFTAKQNRRSQNVMKKIGMAYNGEDDFDHPLLPLEHPLSKHVLYRIRRSYES